MTREGEGEPCIGLEVLDEGGIGVEIGEEKGDGGAKGGGGGGEILRLAKEADDVDHANPADAFAIDRIPLLPLDFSFLLVVVVGVGVAATGEGVVAVPDAEVGVAGPLEGGEGVGYGVGDTEGPQRGFPKTQIGYLIP